MKISFTKPTAQWYKAESAGAASAVVALIGALFFGWPWEPAVLVPLVAFGAAFVTVKD